MSDQHPTGEIVSAKPIENVTWLHLSDWHQGLPDFDRSVLLEGLLDDIGRRADFDPRLARIDLVIFSGDIAFSGTKDEYLLVETDLVAPLREMLGDETKFIFAPGNHDVDRNRIPDIPPDWDKLITSPASNSTKKIGDAFFDARKSPSLLAPFENFYAFAERNGCSYPAGRFIFASVLGTADANVGVVAINTALCCARHALHVDEDKKSEDRKTNNPPQPWDYGTLTISERQLKEAIKQIKHASIKILVMHHPINWMRESEQPVLEQLVADNFDIVLNGHEHLPRFNSVSGNYGEIKFVPAGSAFAGRTPDNPRYTNAFNFGLIDLAGQEGAIHHRLWEEVKGRWKEDTRYWPNGVSRFLIDKKILPNNVKYLFDAQRHFRWCRTKRAARNAEITLAHEQVEIGGRRFIQATVRYVIQLHPGPAEDFIFETNINKRIEGHPVPEVRDRAFTPVKMSPNPTQPTPHAKNGHKIVGSVKLSVQSTTVEYHYRMLECEDGIWCFQIGRFTDNVKIQIRRAKGYEYEFMPMGGFPDRQPGPDGVFEFESLDSDGGHLPGQGYMVQWYRMDVPEPAVLLK